MDRLNPRDWLETVDVEIMLHRLRNSVKGFPIYLPVDQLRGERGVSCCLLIRLLLTTIDDILSQQTFANEPKFAVVSLYFFFGFLMSEIAHIHISRPAISCFWKCIYCITLMIQIQIYFHNIRA